MTLLPNHPGDLIQVENNLWIVDATTNNPAYDFQFDGNYAVSRPWEIPPIENVVARIGAIDHYPDFYNQLHQRQIRLINNPNQHDLASELPHWYPLLSELTPRSMWFDTPPAAYVVEANFSWPVFVKGSRQTSRHDPQKAIAHNRNEFRELIFKYQQDSILGWQQCVIRKFVDLRPVQSTSIQTKIRPSFEFRTFWWHQQLVGAGPYWANFSNYTWSETERTDAIILAQLAANRLDCPFLVIDLAQTAAGKWLIIECNDAQESGYAGISPFTLWNNILHLASASPTS